MNPVTPRSILVAIAFTLLLAGCDGLSTEESQQDSQFAAFVAVSASLSERIIQERTSADLPTANEIIEAVRAMTPEEKAIVRSYISGLDVGIDPAADSEVYIAALERRISADFNKYETDRSTSGIQTAALREACGWEAAKMAIATAVVVGTCATGALPACAAAGANLLIQQGNYIVCMERYYDSQ